MSLTRNPHIKAPVIPAAQTDGLIKLSELTHDLVVQFPVWEGAEPNDSYQLLFDGFPVGNRVIFPDPVPEGLLTLGIPLPLLDVEGVHTVAYRIVGFPGGVPFDTPPAIIRIDRTAPGAALLAPLIFPYPFETLIAHIPGYAGMAVGDTLQSFCNGVPGPVHLIGDDDLSTRLMQIHFSREFLQGLNSAEIEFTYHVTDRAGNQSRLAQPVNLAM
ncbi:hypothetical protein ASF84_13985 [Pseudomonas sp. Leaf127]|uniref:hypothetical protein n=1 Tax=Pseudomonas sp. Leaf127 TaxID=1736267 RepID=UPI000703C08B|nr:hypothetical protein [Pseudomonas sp. Leaf127]KQQ54452.1 hypothetical protein ASF84_13985 [Pseudomonas sp. Leaf127]